MTRKADRRSVLLGFAATGVVVSACEPMSPMKAEAVDHALDLADLEARHGGRIGLTIQGVDRASWRGAERFLYCSTFKLFLAAATLQRVAQNTENLARAIPINAADILPHSPVTETAVGATMTIMQLCKSTVEVSDNGAANILIREFGGLDAWRAWYPSIGDGVTRVDRLEPELNLADGDRDTTTPDQTIANLSHVLRNDPLTRGMPPYLLSWLLASPTGAKRIKAALAPGYLAMHKTGTSGRGQANDIGQIQTPDRKGVLIAVYFEGPSSASADQLDAVIADATRRALMALGHDVAA
ncbi:class A beta-lactamase [Brevundimonas sp.]|uniref:class A beta-lactamase n=1 Tax=Brevundimonas sp. TaxID=1871086 RepID=UPI002B6255CC|nr:class A beta-lactamase [Brevundimonas sp.]HWQ86570.1 class A beta-lactamase [Brevundimonas sp.]